MRRGRAIAMSTVVGVAAAVSTATVTYAATVRGDAGVGFGARRGEGRPLLMLLLLAAVIVLAVLLWRGRRTPSLTSAAAPAAPAASPILNAQAILADRLARGEISPDDYRAAVSVLRETSPS